MWVQGANLCKVYNYHDSQACGYKRSRILPRIDGFEKVLGVAWYWIKMIVGIALRSCVIYSNPFVDHTMW
jgi:hypothetical protein